MTTLLQPSHELAMGLLIVTSLLQPCNNLATTIQACSNVVCFILGVQADRLAIIDYCSKVNGTFGGELASSVTNATINPCTGNGIQLQ